MTEKDLLNFFRMSGGKRGIIKNVKELSEACREEYWAALLEDGAVLTFHGDPHGEGKTDQCYDELWKVSESLRKEMTS